MTFNSCKWSQKVVNLALIPFSISAGGAISAFTDKPKILEQKNSHLCAAPLNKSTALVCMLHFFLLQADFVLSFLSNIEYRYVTTQTTKCSINTSALAKIL